MRAPKSSRLPHPPAGIAPGDWERWCGWVDSRSDPTLEQFSLQANNPGFALAWPHLCSRALAKGADTKPLRALFGVFQAHQQPTLPSTFLKEFLERAVSNPLRASNARADVWLFSQVAFAVSRPGNPQVLDNATWKNWNKALGWQAIGLEGLEEELEKTPWYAPQRSRWLRNLVNRREVVGKMGHLSSLVSSGNWGSHFQEVWGALDPAHRPLFLAELSERLCAADVQAKEKFERVSRAYANLLRVVGSTALANTAWSTWWPQRVNELWTPYRSKDLLQQIARAMKIESHPLPGVAWSAQRLARWGVSLAKGMGNSATPEWPLFAQLSFVKGVLQLHAWMPQWGGWQPHALEAFHQALDNGCPGWKERLMEKPASLEADPDMENWWRPWHAGQLDARLGNHAAPAPRVRL